MHQIRFRFMGCAPDPAVGAHSAFPDHPDGYFRGPTFKGMEGGKKRKGRKGTGWGWNRGEGEKRE